MIASNYRDGNEDLDARMTSREKNYALKQMPSFIEYCNYVYALVSSVIGPSFEFKDWNDFLNMESPFNTMPKYGNLAPAFIRLGQGLLCIPLTPLISAYFPIDDLISPEFANHSYPYRMLHMWMGVQITWWTYFVGFCLIEANLIASGFGYRKVKGNSESDVIVHNYNSVRLVNIK